MSLRSLARSVANRLTFSLPPGTTTGQQTQKQLNARGPFGSPMGMGGFAGFGGGYSVRAGTFDHYREIRSNPTVALGLAALTCPIKAAPWSYEIDDDAPEEALKLVQTELDRLKPTLLRDLTRAVWMGFQPFEKVWQFKDGRYTIERMHTLLQELTTPYLDDRGRLVMAKNGAVDLEPSEFLWYTYDPEGDDPFGRSLFENIRKAFARLNNACSKMDGYIQKNAGVIPMVFYEPGRAPGRDGVERDNSEHAANLIHQLQGGSGVIIPKEFAPWAEAALSKGASAGDVSKLLTWGLEFLECRAGAGSEILAAVQHEEKLLLRGLLVPERAVTEGQFGTKAEAEAHGDIMLSVAAEIAADMVRCINAQLVDDLLVYNFGPSMKGKVRIIAGPLTDTDKAFARRIMEAVLTNPANIDLLLAMTDMDAMADKAMWPKLEEVINNALLPHGDPANPDPANPPNPDPNAPNAPPQPKGSPFPKPGDKPPPSAKLSRTAAHLKREMDRVRASINGG